MAKLDQYKPRVLSLHLIGRGLEQQHADGESVAQLSQRFDRLTARAAVWYKELHIAFLSSKDTHNSIERLSTWLGDVSSRVDDIEPVNTRSTRSDMMSKLEKLQVCGFDFFKTLRIFVGKTIETYLF